MSRRTIISLAASVIVAIGFLALFRPMPPYIIAAVFIAVAFTVAASTVVCGREWRWASVLLPSALPRSALLPPVLITHLVITARPPRSLVHTVTIIIPLRPMRTHAIMAAMRRTSEER